eukprot:TRINITY_DN55976_c0_g1_i1.p2 TRINITY_DN55976_c0_g1~~TRINITY_DN55976_c0_g1_i1.p2  ORF type:complete len:116 (+),score=5.80 TRINITY_DN55976_c0_g1_i1:343-690(+)
MRDSPGIHSLSPVCNKAAPGPAYAVPSTTELGNGTCPNSGRRSPPIHSFSSHARMPARLGELKASAPSSADTLVTAWNSLYKRCANSMGMDADCSDARATTCESCNQAQSRRANR